MDTARKLDLLKDAYADAPELDLLLGKLLDVVLSQHRLRLARYEHDLRAYEGQYRMASAVFHTRFNAGELGDSMDFFEWAGVYELREDLRRKVQELEQAA